MDLKNLINLLPFHFKEADTYKNKEGKGLLERYLNIFGKYFDEDIKLSVESMRDYVTCGMDVKSHDYRKIETYLITSGLFKSNYFWDFLGQMPYARLVLPQDDPEVISKGISSLKTTRSYRGFSHEPFKDNLKLETFTDIDPDSMDRLMGYIEIGFSKEIEGSSNGMASSLDLLLFSVPLYKIRGTEKFFRVYFEMWDDDGIVTVDSISDSIDPVTSTINTNDGNQVIGSDQEFYSQEVPTTKGKMDVITKLDQADNLLDGCNLDSHPSCQKCKTVNVVMKLDSSFIPINEKGFFALHSKVQSIFDRFLPINVKANITYNVDSVNANFLSTNPSITTYIWSGEDWVINSSTEWNKYNYIDVDRKEVKIKVVITDTTTYGSKINYHFEVGPSSSDGPIGVTNRSENLHQSGDIITITNPGTYLIRVCENKVEGPNLKPSPVTNQIQIRNVLTSIEPSITYELVNSDGEGVTGFESGEYTQRTYYLNVFSYINNEWASFYVEEPDGTKNLIVNYDDIDDGGRKYFSYPIKKAGIYKLSVASYPTCYTLADVGLDEPEYAYITLEPRKGYTITKELPTLPVTISAYQEYISGNKFRITLKNGRPISLSKVMRDLYQDDDISQGFTINKDSIYHQTPVIQIVQDSNSGYVHCFLNLRRTAWVGEYTYIQLANVPVDDKNSFIGIRDISKGTLTKLPIQWKAPYYDIDTPHCSYKVKDSVPYNIGGYLRDSNTTTFLEILSTTVGYVKFEGQDTYYNDGDILYLDQVGDYYMDGAIPQLDQKGIPYEYDSDEIQIDQNIVDIGPLSYILSPQGVFFYPNANPPEDDTVTFTLTCVTTLTWARGRAYKAKNLIPINGILQQYRPQSDGQNKWVVGVDGNPNGTTNKFEEEDLSYSTYTLKHTYTIKYGDYSTYPTRIKLGGLVNQYIDVHLGVFIDPEKNYIYVQPEDALDRGWSKPNWGSAKLSDATNTPDRVEYDLMADKLRFTVQQTRIDSIDDEKNEIRGGGDLGGRVSLYMVTTQKKVTIQDGKEVETYEEVETYTGQSYEIGTEVISNIKTTGKYRLRGEGDYAANYIDINVVSSGTFKVICDPPISTLSSEGFATTRVTATCDTPNIPSYQLQVRRDQEQVWHDIPYDFIATSYGVYHFFVRGNTAIGASFSVVAKLTVSTNKSQLNWAADNTDIQEVELTADDNLQWSLEISDE
nr:MAG TPA: hypothetical protein [Caudoviricetes sp.]